MIKVIIAVLLLLLILLIIIIMNIEWMINDALVPTDHTWEEASWRLSVRLCGGKGKGECSLAVIYHISGGEREDKKRECAIVAANICMGGTWNTNLYETWKGWHSWPFLEYCFPLDLNTLPQWSTQQWSHTTLTTRELRLWGGILPAAGREGWAAQWGWHHPSGDLAGTYYYEEIFNHAALASGCRTLHNSDDIACATCLSPP